MKGSSRIHAPIPRAFSIVSAAGILAFSAPAAAQDGGWQLDPFGRVEAGVVSARATNDDYEFIYIGDAAYFRGQAGMELADEDSAFRLELDRIMVERFSSDRPNTDRDRFTASFEQDFGKAWEVLVRLRGYDDLVSAEFNDTDALELTGRVEYEPVRAHRFRFGLTWRERQYDDGDGADGGSTRGSGWKASGSYRHRLGRYHYVTLDARAEEIDSDNARRTFARQTVSASYTHPLTSDLRLRPALTLRHTTFPGRGVVEGEPREDTYLTPELEALWWKGPVRVEAEAKYVISDSSDPERDRKGHRLSLSVGYVF